MTPGGNGKSFLWVCQVKTVGLIVQGTQPVKLGPSGFGGKSIRYQPMVGRKKTGTPSDVRASVAVFEVQEIGSGAQESVRRPKHLFIRTEVAGIAYGSLLNPFTLQTMWARRSAYLFASLTIPSVLDPEGLRFPGVLPG